MYKRRIRADADIIICAHNKLHVISFFVFIFFGGMNKHTAWNGLSLKLHQQSGGEYAMKHNYSTQIGCEILILLFAFHIALALSIARHVRSFEW